MARVKITKIPKALSGLEVKMSAGLYGKPTNGNRQFTLPNQIMSQKFAQEPTTVRNTLQPVAREGANLEAEKGETAVMSLGGLPAHFKIGGKRHSQGGTPLNLPDNSFIFSDTAKMKIKDPIIIAQFGMVPKKAGYTPAEIAKKFDINKFRQILADPNSEDLERKTAEAMIANYNMKLAKLALIQESMKGFPQGVPAIAMPYIIENDIDPSTYLPTQSQEEQPDADTGEARYGGNMISQFNTKKYGGLPTAQTGKQKEEWDKAGAAYLKEYQDYLNRPQADYFDISGGLKDLWDAIQFGDQSVHPASAKTVNKESALKKLNPLNSEGTMDYLMNILQLPESTVNYGLTGRFEPTKNFATGLVIDPTTYLGYGPILKHGVKGTKAVGTAAKEAAQEVTKDLAKYGPKALEFVKLYGKQGLDLLMQYGEKAFEMLGKVKIPSTVGNFALSAGTRGLQGYGANKEKNEKINKIELENKLLKEQLERQKKKDNTPLVKPKEVVKTVTTSEPKTSVLVEKPVKSQTKKTETKSKNESKFNWVD